MTTKKNKSSVIKPAPPEESPGSRLANVVNRYFGNQTILSELAKIDKGSLSSYISGRKNFTEKFAKKLEEKVHINSQYLLYGKEPITLNNRKPLHDGHPNTIVRAVNFGVHPQHGTTRHYTLMDERGKTHIKDTGESNIVNLLFANLTDLPVMLYQFSNIFAKEYNIKHGTLFVCELKDFFNDDDIVIYEKSNNGKLGYCRNAEIIELNTSMVENLEDIEIFGCVLYRIEEFRYGDQDF